MYISDIENITDYILIYSGPVRKLNQISIFKITNWACKSPTFLLYINP